MSTTLGIGIGLRFAKRRGVSGENNVIVEQLDSQSFPDARYIHGTTIFKSETGEYIFGSSRNSPSSLIASVIKCNTSNYSDNVTIQIVPSEGSDTKLIALEQIVYSGSKLYTTGATNVDDGAGVDYLIQIDPINNDYKIFKLNYNLGRVGNRPLTADDTHIYISTHTKVLKYLTSDFEDPVWGKWNTDYGDDGVPISPIVGVDIQITRVHSSIVDDYHLYLISGDHPREIQKLRKTDLFSEAIESLGENKSSDDIVMTDDYIVCSSEAFAAGNIFAFKKSDLSYKCINSLGSTSTKGTISYGLILHKGLIYIVNISGYIYVLDSTLIDKWEEDSPFLDFVLTAFYYDNTLGALNEFVIDFNGFFHGFRWVATPILSKFYLDLSLRPPTVRLIGVEINEEWKIKLLFNKNIYEKLPLIECFSLFENTVSGVTDLVDNTFCLSVLDSYGSDVQEKVSYNKPTMGEFLADVPKFLRSIEGRFVESFENISVINNLDAKIRSAAAFKEGVIHLVFNTKLKEVDIGINSFVVKTLKGGELPEIEDDIISVSFSNEILIITLDTLYSVNDEITVSYLSPEVEYLQGFGTNKKVLNFSNFSVLSPPSVTNVKCGYLYNWPATQNASGLAPEGYHIPSREELNTLNTYLIDNGYSYDGGANSYIAKSMALDHTYWTIAFSAGVPGNNDYPEKVNISGFSARPSGTRSEVGVFSNNTKDFKIWTTTPFGLKAYGRVIYFDNRSFISNTIFMKTGISCRCIRDTLEGWVEGEQLIDIDGNVYDTIKIGGQVFTVQNLATSRYKDGVVIPLVTDGGTWAGLETGGRCAYNNDEGNVFL